MAHGALGGPSSSGGFAKSCRPQRRGQGVRARPIEGASVLLDQWRRVAFGSYLRRRTAAAPRAAAARAAVTHTGPASSATGSRTATRPRPYEASTGTPSDARAAGPQQFDDDEVRALVVQPEPCAPCPAFHHHRRAPRPSCPRDRPPKQRLAAPVPPQARASSAALQESSLVALTPFSDVDDQRDASVKRGLVDCRSFFDGR